MRDADATRRRILDAATAEFAEHGIAGARVDRIAASARSNKALIYSYFGNKDELFDVVFDAHVVSNVDRVPFTPRDLPGYVVRLYDAYLDDPALARLLGWKRLERTPTGDMFETARHDAEKLRGIRDAQRDGVLVQDLAPREMWAMIVALAATWAQGSIVHVATRDERAADHRRRRAALAAVATRSFVTA